MTLLLLVDFFICKKSLIPRYVASRYVDFVIAVLGEVVIALPTSLARYIACRLTPSLSSVEESCHR